MNFEKKRSNYWFLLPILVGLIGGIIAFFVLKRDDPRKAKNCLYIGIVLFVIGIIINIAIFGLAIPLENDIGVNL
jgi:uncharacterized membrane protein YeaQ/YmgE (transglycosylase-associated protein family)